MTIPTFDPDRLAALRAGLVEHTTATPRRGLPVWAGITTFAVAGALVGGAVSAAAAGIIPGAPSHHASPFTIGSAAGLKGVPAPPGTQPGMPIISLLGGGKTIQATSSRTLPLTDIPAAATDVRVTVTCLSVGDLAWGTDPTGNNPTMRCGSADIGTNTATSFSDFPLKGADHAVYLDVTGVWIVSYQYIRKVETAWGINSHGQTYGVEKNGAGSPELIAVTGQTADGSNVNGYAFATQLQTPPGTHQPTSPADAVKQQDETAKKYPNGIQIPIYKSDGTTRIGTFTIGGP